VQGFGNVGSAAFYWLKWVQSYRYNRQRWRFNKRKRLYFEEIRALFLAKDGNTLVAEHDSFEEINQNMDNRCRNFHLALHQD
jgi:hypothetical protein